MLTENTFQKYTRIFDKCRKYTKIFKNPSLSKGYAQAGIVQILHYPSLRLDKHSCFPHDPFSIFNWVVNPFSCRTLDSMMMCVWTIEMMHKQLNRPGQIGFNIKFNFTRCIQAREENMVAEERVTKAGKERATWKRIKLHLRVWIRLLRRRWQLRWPYRLRTRWRRPSIPSKFYLMILVNFCFPSLKSSSLWWI